MNASITHAAPAATDHLHPPFLAALPGLLRVARFRFRGLRCCDTRDDRVCETIALCWVWYLRLLRRGRNPAAFMTALAHYGATAVGSGRRACGQEKANDMLSPRCQRGRGVTVVPLPDERTPDESALHDAIRENTQTPVVDQVQFRCDFPAWRGRFPARKQRLIDRLALGHRAKDLATEFRLSEGRISQLRREFYEDYSAFCADPRPAVDPAAALRKSG